MAVAEREEQLVVELPLKRKRCNQRGVKKLASKFWIRKNISCGLSGSCKVCATPL